MQNLADQNITLYSVRHLRKETDQMSEKAELHLAALTKVSVQTVSAFLKSEHAQFCFKPLAKTLKYFI